MPRPEFVDNLETVPDAAKHIPADSESVRYQKYEQRRRYFEPDSANSAKQIGFYFCPVIGSTASTNTQGIPRPSADRLADVSPEEFRAHVALAFLRIGIGQAVNGGKDFFQPGSNDVPVGRRGAYLDCIAPFESPTSRASLAASTSNNANSSCGMFIRAVWQLLGGGKPNDGQPERQFRSEYKNPSQVINDIVELAKGYGAVHEPKVGDNPPGFGEPLKELRPGDVLFVRHTNEPGQHIFTVTGVRECNDAMPLNCDAQAIVHSVDGGNGHTGDGECTGIKTLVRTMYRKKVTNEWVVGKYTVVSHINLDKVQPSFVDPWILPYTP